MTKLIEVVKVYQNALKEINDAFYGDGCDAADEARERAREILEGGKE